MLSQDNVQQKSAQPAESEMQWALPIAGMPFSAEMVTERSDGRDGTEPQVTLIYRDAKGRVLHEYAPVKQGPVSIQFFNLIDPVAKFSATWIDPVKTLFRAALPVDQGDFKPSFAIFTFAGLGLDPKEQKIVNESLGREIIEGLAFEGFPRTISVREDRNIVASEEFWQSKELGLIGRRVGFGPSGTMTSQIRKLVRLEPDPVLFAMPQGYAIRDISE